MPRPVTPTSWRSAPLPAVPCRQMATPPIRILALPQRRLFAMHIAPAIGSRCCRLAVSAVCQAGPFFPGSGPADQPPRSPGTLAPRALRETPITFPARFPRPPSSVSSRAGTARCQANRLRYYPHRRMAHLPVRSPTNGLSRRFIALPAHLFFALHRCAPSTCQNDKWPPEGRIRCSADYRFRQHT